MRTNRLLEFLAEIEPMMALFWFGLAIFTVTMAVLLYTRWGQYRPLRKCMAMSVLVHLLLVSYAATIQIITPVPGRSGSIFAVSFDEEDAAVATTPMTTDQPWETFAEADTRLENSELPRAEFDLPAPPQRTVRADSPPIPGDTALLDVAIDGAKLVVPNKAIGRAATLSPVPIDVPAAQRREAPEPVPGAPSALKRLTGDSPPPLERESLEDLPPTLLQELDMLPPSSGNDDLGLVSAPANTRTQTLPRSLEEVMGYGTEQTPETDSAYRDAASAGISSSASNPGSANGSGVALSGVPHSGVRESKTLPDAYRLRVAPNRPDVARGNGGTAETEAAVAAALEWLADNQDANGQWNPRTHDAGKEMKVLGRDRLGAGSHADTAVTGLSLLAFLASGNTHLDGHYKEDVRRALEYLLRTQAADGNLGGQAATFEFMYCHAMASCALSEAYGMTRDVRLREPVRRAVAYTISAQDPIGGGWRYRPGDPGDTSQLGWQLMTLKSAELAGIPISAKTRKGIVRYLRSVSSGKYGGFASYRPGEARSRSMTAEALVCWQFLGLARQHPACNEAGDYLLEEVPGEGGANFYYWYYATLGMYQLQGEHWKRWNDAMRDVVVARQVKTGPNAGSWDTDTTWGKYGGRVYTTALATLTLEVYYRFLPLYAEVAGGGKVATRPTSNSGKR